MPLTRRQVILTGLAAGGGLLVAVGLRPNQDVRRASARIAGANEHLLTTFLKIGADDTVTVIVTHCEMGQGVYTALPMLAAEELGADWAKVRVEHAPASPEFVSGQVLLTFIDQITGYEPGAITRPPMRWGARRAARMFDVMFTGASTSIRSNWVTLREAGATARALLVSEAAARWEVSEDECDTNDGKVVHAASARSFGFGELAEAAAGRTPPRRPVLRDPARFTLIGTSVPRLDIPDKTCGRARFGVDVRPPGMKHAALRTGRFPGMKLRRFDDEAALRMSGVLAVVPLEDAVAVVAESWWEASQAAQAIDAEFTIPESAPADSEQAEQRIRRALDDAKRSRRLRRGDAESGLAAAARQLEAEYIVPHLAHACMEPMNCTAWIHAGRCEVWLPTQAPLMARTEAARVSGLRKRDVEVHTTLLGGGFGRRAEVDLVTQAVAIAKAVPWPVQLTWNRTQDLQLGVFRPMVVSRMRGGVDESGQPVAWTQHFNGSDGGVDLLPYTVPNALVHATDVEDALPWGHWRSVDHSQHCFFVESMIDELAALGDRDPVALRRALLPADSRLRGVLDRVAEASGWGGPLPPGHGRGVAISACFGAYVAEVAQVSVGEDGRVRVHRVDCAMDCGRIINPDTVRSQVEGGILFGLSAALREQVSFHDHEIDQANLDSYQLLGMADAPDIHVHLIASEAPPGGVGEPPTPPIAPALVNALYAATGRRIRRLPLSSAGFA
ncbi:MAG: xanthine dehydrogenase family protein molybdopterin-binding subunit [Gammaproteobacteria bacterium]|nr:xanthine dehydrogenase family protein molybdopterin-binding subunit [Gammaproteobacteria bacterium]